MPALYDLIGSTYAKTRLADPGIAQNLAREIRLTSSGAYLDLACGTGNYTVALSSLGGTWTATDVSDVMLTQARKKSNNISWVQSSADALPFPDAAFDGAICTLAIHHFPDLESPFTEIRRTLRSGSFVIFTGLKEQMRHYWLCHYFPVMMARAIDNMPSEPQIRTVLLNSGFKSISVNPFFVTNQLQDLFLFSGKRRPDLYLDPGVRANISSFAHLAATGEVQHGLARLAADIRSGAVDKIIAQYGNEIGDYAYITACADT